MSSSHYYTDTQDVANAVGAALGTVGGSCDRIEDMVWLQRELCNSDPAASSLSETELYKRARQVALQRAEEIARQNAVEKGIGRINVGIVCF